MPMGKSVITTTRKIIVSAESKIVSAISFGVFWRFAPSTSVIMRSRKLSPGFAVMRTLIWSDNTFVPPVTALRSPPASRMTGADSPVIADSSTVAAPSIISPSPGMTSPATTKTISPFRSSSAATCCSVPSCLYFKPKSCVRDLRSASACDFPRPSAIASAKFAKSTVNQSQIAIWITNARGSWLTNISYVVMNRADHRHKHDGVANHPARVELQKRILDRSGDNRAFKNIMFFNGHGCLE